MEKNKNILSKIGKIKNYDGLTGEIASLDGLYYFTRNDTSDEINKADTVKFNVKTEEIFPQAYYIKKLSNEEEH